MEILLELKITPSQEFRYPLCNLIDKLVHRGFNEFELTISKFDYNQNPDSLGSTDPPLVALAHLVTHIRSHHDSEFIWFGKMSSFRNLRSITYIPKVGLDG